MGSNQVSRKNFAHSPFRTTKLLGARPSLSWVMTKSIRSPFRLLNVLMTLSGGTTGALVIMYDSSLAGVRSEVWMGVSMFMIRAVWSRYHMNMEVGWSVMAWRIAGTRAQVGGELPIGYLSLVGKKVR